MSKIKKIIIFASGNGSNAENLILKLSADNIKINWQVFTNNPKAGVIKRCEALNVVCEIFEKQLFLNSSEIEQKILKINPDVIILAGFLLKIPTSFIKMNFPIINIHPSLLPKYGGKGMYGNYIHAAVIKNKEPFSGITVHKVNSNYDEGEVLFQKAIKLDKNESIISLSKKINSLEMKCFPEVIRRLIT
jgi:phosphoribosylglycinamide formyltransferase-1